MSSDIDNLLDDYEPKTFCPGCGTELFLVNWCLGISYYQCPGCSKHYSSSDLKRHKTSRRSSKASKKS